MITKGRVQVFTLFILIVLAFLPSLFFYTETSKAEAFTLKYASFPALCLAIWLVKTQAGKELNARSIFVGVAGATILLVFLSFGYILGINALLHRGEILVSGKITNMYNTSGYKGSDGSYAVEVYNSKQSISQEFWVSKSEYKKLVIGETYHKNWKLGFFGLLYR